MEYYITLRKKKVMQFEATWMELEDVCHAELSQSEEKGQI